MAATPPAAAVESVLRLGLSRPRHWIEPIGRPEVPTLPDVTRTASIALLKRIVVLFWMFSLTRASLASRKVFQAQLSPRLPSRVKTPRAKALLYQPQL